MLKMGFDRNWVNLVMNYVTTVEFSVLINGHQGERFKSTRGLRRGDPLSPYLFPLVSEVPSLLIRYASDVGFVEGIRINVIRPCLSHLLFAYDTLIFLKATRNNCQNIVNLLNAYCHASVQEVSLQKFVVYFNVNTPVEVCQDLCSILNMPQVEDLGKYLGISTDWGSSKKEAMAYVKDRVFRKIRGWKQQFISQAGWEVLIKVVA
ncbi:hypothetical protein COP2_013296 [Malus domestica]